MCTTTLTAPASRRISNIQNVQTRRKYAKAARRAAADQLRASKVSKAAKIEAMILQWEAAIQKAHECYGEMNTLEERMMELMATAGVKSVRLSDGRVVACLEEFKSPCHATTVIADFIQVIPAGVIPE